MAVTQAQIDALNQAISDGVRQVTIGGVTTTYNTTESLIKARDDQQEQLRLQNLATAGKPRRAFRRLYQSGRGY